MNAMWFIEPRRNGMAGVGGGPGSGTGMVPIPPFVA